MQDWDFKVAKQHKTTSLFPASLKIVNQYDYKRCYVVLIGYK